MPTETIPMEQVFEQRAAASQVEEANRYPTLKSGSYVLQATKAEIKQYDDGTQVAHFSAKATGIPHPTTGVQQKGTVFFDAAWTEQRGVNGKLRTSSKLWGNILKALWPALPAGELANKTVGEVCEAMTRFPVSAYVVEAFRIEDATQPNGYRTTYPRSEDEITAARLAGGVPKNYVQNISAVK